MEDRARTEVTPSLFFAALSEAGFNLLHYVEKTLSAEDRKKVFLGIMMNAQDLLLTRLTQQEGRGHIVLLGQEHNNTADIDRAMELASNLRGGILLIERDGNLHPEINPIGIMVSAVGQGTTVTEHQLQSDHPGMPDPTLGERGFLLRPAAPLREVERSWLVGMYIANLIFTNPERPISVIFGENHLNDIMHATNLFLRYLHCAVAPEVSVIPSAATTGLEATKPLEFEELLSSKRDSAPILEVLREKMESVKLTALSSREVDLMRQRTFFIKEAMKRLGADSAKDMTLQTTVTMAMDALLKVHSPEVCFEHVDKIKSVMSILKVLNAGFFQEFSSCLQAGIPVEKLQAEAAFTRGLFDELGARTVNLKAFQTIHQFLATGGSEEQIYHLAKTVMSSHADSTERVSALLRQLAPEPSVTRVVARDTASAAAVDASDLESAVTYTPLTSFAELTAGLGASEKSMLRECISVAARSGRLEVSDLQDAMFRQPHASGAVGNVGDVMALVDDAVAQLSAAQAKGFGKA